VMRNFRVVLANALSNLTQLTFALLTQRMSNPASRSYLSTHREAHGCPYRHFSLDNLNVLSRGRWIIITDLAILRGVKEDVEATKYYMAYNRVFEYAHKEELKREKEKQRSGPAPVLL